MLRRAAIVALAGLGACQDGTVQVVLVRPAVEDARPAPAATAVLRLMPAGGEEVFRTGAVVGADIDFGEIPVDAYVRAEVELRDPSNGLVAFGRVVEPLSVEPEGGAIITIPIRRPRVLAVGPAPSRATGADPVAPLETASATTLQLDVSGGALPAVARSAPGPTQLTASAGPDQFVAVGGAIHRLDTYADMFVGAPVVDLGMPILDLAGSSDGRWLAAGTAGGMHVIELAAPTPRLFVPGRRVDAVTWTVDADGVLAAVALVDAARSPAQCPRASKLVVVRPSDGEGETGGRELDPGGGLADIGGSPGRPRLVAAGVCDNRSLLFGFDPDRVVATDTTVTAPTAVAALEDRAWIAGVRPGVVQMVPGTSDRFTAVAANPELIDFDLATDLGTRFDLPGLSESMYTNDDSIRSISQNTNAKSAAIQGMAVSPTGDQLTLAVTELYNHPPLYVDAGLLGTFPVFPPIVLHASRLLVVSTQSSRVAQQVRTYCNVCMEPDSETEISGTPGSCNLTESWLYAAWVCASPPGLLEPVTDLELGGVAAIYGAP